MSSMCKSLAVLSAQGQWDNVFYCLKVDTNTTIDLANLKVPQDRETTWLEEAKSTLNTLEVILAFILLCDQIMYVFLLLYIALIIVNYLRYNVIQGYGLNTWSFVAKRNIKFGKYRNLIKRRK